MLVRATKQLVVVLQTTWLWLLDEGNRMGLLDRILFDQSTIRSARRIHTHKIN